jgi:hypothetical protein
VLANYTRTLHHRQPTLSRTSSTKTWRKPHRPAALTGIKVDTHLEGRDEAIDGCPSTEIVPQAFQILDLHSPRTTTAVEGSSSKTQPPFFHKAHSQLCNLDTKGWWRRHQKTTSNRWTQTPKQGVHKRNATSTSSPSTSKQNTNETRVSEEELIPRWRQHHHLNVRTLTLENLWPIINKRTKISTPRDAPQGIRGEKDHRLRRRTELACLTESENGKVGRERIRL